MHRTFEVRASASKQQETIARSQNTKSNKGNKEIYSSRKINMDQHIQEEGLHITESRGGEQSVWLFNGEASHFPSAVFLSFTRALNWIERYSLTGTLTQYPLDKSVFDWAVENEFYQPNSTRVKCGPKTVANFSSAYLEHFHFKDGISQEDLSLVINQHQ